MRNAVIRKKRLKVERTLEDFLRMPQRIMVPHIEINGYIPKVTDEDIERMASSRIWALP